MNDNSKAEFLLLSFISNMATCLDGHKIKFLGILIFFMRKYLPNNCFVVSSILNYFLCDAISKFCSCGIFAFMYPG